MRYQQISRKNKINFLITAINVAGFVCTCIWYLPSLEGNQFQIHLFWKGNLPIEIMSLMGCYLIVASPYVYTSSSLISNKAIIRALTIIGFLGHALGMFVWVHDLLAAAKII